MEERMKERMKERMEERMEEWIEERMEMIGLRGCSGWNQQLKGNPHEKK